MNQYKDLILALLILDASFGEQSGRFVKVREGEMLVRGIKSSLTQQQIDKLAALGFDWDETNQVFRAIFCMDWPER